jgi:hypothetical protein
MSKRIVITILLFAVGLFVTLQNPMIFLDPGPVITGHTKIEGDCFQCHTPLLGPNDEKCIACHKPAKIGVGKPGKLLFHHQLQENRCVNCHTDHIGIEAAKATHTFDHSLLVSLSQNACQKCHTSPKDTLHRDMTLTSGCAQCHGTEKWKPATIDHTKYFEFDMDHEAKCSVCHTTTDYKKYTCYECHEHSPEKIRQEHWEEGIRNYETCVTCHRNADEDEAERAWESIRKGIPYQFGIPYENTHRKWGKRDHDDD